MELRPHETLNQKEVQQEKISKATEFKLERIESSSLPPVSTNEGDGFLDDEARPRFLKDKKTRTMKNFIAFGKSYFKVFELNGSKTGFKYLHSGHLDDPKRLIDWQKDPNIHIHKSTGSLMIADTFARKRSAKPNSSLPEEIFYCKTKITKNTKILKIQKIHKVKKFNPPYYVESVSCFYPRYLENSFINSSVFFFSKYFYGGTKYPGKKEFSYMADSVRNKSDSEGRWVKSVFEIFGWDFENEHLKEKLEEDKLLVKDLRIRNQLKFTFRRKDEFSVLSENPEGSSYYYSAILKKQLFCVIALIDLRYKKVLKKTYLSVYEVWDALDPQILKGIGSLYIFGVRYSFSQGKFYLNICPQKVINDGEEFEEAEEEVEQEEEELREQGMEDMEEQSNPEEQFTENQEEGPGHRAELVGEYLPPSLRENQSQPQKGLQEALENHKKSLIYTKLFNRSIISIAVDNIFEMNDRKFEVRPLSENCMFLRYDISTRIQVEELLQTIKFTFIDENTGSRRSVFIDKKSNELSSRLTTLQTICKVDNSKLVFCDVRKAYLVDLDQRAVLDTINYSHLFCSDLYSVRATDDLVLTYEKWRINLELFRIRKNSIRLVKEIDLIEILGERGQQMVRINNILCLKKIDNYTLLLSFISDVLFNSAEYATEQIIASCEISLLNGEVKKVGLIEADHNVVNWEAYSMTYDAGRAFLLYKSGSEVVVVCELDENYQWNLKSRMIYDAEGYIDGAFYRQNKLFVAHHGKLNLIKFFPTDRKPEPVLIRSIDCWDGVISFSQMNFNNSFGLIWHIEKVQKFVEKYEKAGGEGEVVKEGGDEDQGEGEPVPLRSVFEYHLIGYDFNLEEVHKIELDLEKSNSQDIDFIIISSQKWLHICDRPILRSKKSFYIFDFEKKVIKKIEQEVMDQLKFLTQVPNGDLILYEAKKPANYLPELPSAQNTLFRIRLE